MITVRIEARRITVTEDGQMVGAGVYHDVYTAARDLGALGKELPEAWVGVPNAHHGMASGVAFRSALRVDRVERAARALENEHHLHRSAWLVRAYAANRIWHDWLHRLIVDRGIHGRMCRYRRQHPRAKPNQLAEAEKAAREHAVRLCKRRKKAYHRWLAQHGFPWPEDMP